MKKDSFSASDITNLAEFKGIPGLNTEKWYLEGRFGAIPVLKYKLDGHQKSCVQFRNRKL